MIEVCTIGGYESVGKNMTAVKTGEVVFIFDAGLDIPSLIELQNDHVQIHSEEQLRKGGAIANDLILDKLGWTKNVRAIMISHAHLDHVGGLPWIINRYPNAVILGTPFTMEVFKTLLEDEKRRAKNPIKYINPDDSFTIKGKSGTYKIEFINMTHSTIQTATIALSTPSGKIVYALDVKLDDKPVIGNPPNYKRLKQVGKEGVKLLIMDSLYSGSPGRTPSESVARRMLRTSIQSITKRNSAFFITTFSSHIARIKSIVEFSRKTNRKLVFLGRSMYKYIKAAEKVHQADFTHNVELLKYRKQVDSFLKKLNDERGRYLVVCTGHQAEEGSVLDRIVRGQTAFRFKDGDSIIFSSKIIPAPENVEARRQMDERLRHAGVNIHDNVHVSGHGSADELKDMLTMIKPEIIIPTHGSKDQELPMIEIARKMGYKYGKNVLLSQDGKVLKL